MGSRALLPLGCCPKAAFNRDPCYVYLSRTSQNSNLAFFLVGNFAMFLKDLCCQRSTAWVILYPRDNWSCLCVAFSYNSCAPSHCSTDPVRRDVHPYLLSSTDSFQQTVKRSIWHAAKHCKNPKAALIFFPSEREERCSPSPSCSQAAALPTPPVNSLQGRLLAKTYR